MCQHTGNEGNECNQTSTPEYGNRWYHSSKSRITFKLKIPAVENPAQVLSNIIQDFVQEPCKADQLAAILLWRVADTHLKHITKPTDVPTFTSKMCQYLKKLYVGKANKETTMYPGIYMGHNKEFHELREELSIYWN